MSERYWKNEAARYEVERNVARAEVKSKDEEVRRLKALVRELVTAAECIVNKCDVCGKPTDHYVEDNGPYCSKQCWGEANGDDGYDYELETYEPVTKIMEALDRARKELGE